MPVPLIAAVFATLGFAGPPTVASAGTRPRAVFTVGDMGSLFADNVAGRVEIFSVFFATIPPLAVPAGLLIPAGCCATAFPGVTLFGMLPVVFAPEVWREA